jgi:hypothetical protein
MATQEQIALFQKHYRPRTDGGLDYGVEDQVHQLRQQEKLSKGSADPDHGLYLLAHASGLSVDYWRSLRATMKKGRKRKGE